MSDISNRPVDNGARLYVHTAFFKGIAGVRATAAGGEFAFIGDMSVPRDRSGTIEGKAIRVTSLRPSGFAAGMVVAQFEMVPEA